MKVPTNKGYSDQVVAELEKRYANIPKAVFEVEEKVPWGWQFYGVIILDILDRVMLKDADTLTLQELQQRYKITTEWVERVHGQAKILYKWLEYKHWRTVRIYENGDRQVLETYKPEFDVPDDELRQMIAEARRAREEELEQKRIRHNEMHKKFLNDHPGYMEKKREERRQKDREYKRKKRLKEQEAKKLEFELRAKGVIK